MHKNDEYSHSEIIHQCNFGFRHFINTCLTAGTSLQKQLHLNTQDTGHHCLNPNDTNSHHGTEDTTKTFPTMLTLISGTLVGGVKYSDLYIDSGEEEETSSTESYVTNNNMDHKKNNTLHKVPTLPQIARKVAMLEKTQLDEKQYIAYEMIACIFLLGLVNDGQDKTTKLGTYKQQTMDDTTNADANDIIEKIKARGGRDQLLMFLTWPAGSGQSTVMKIAQQFCYEFCMAVGIMWVDKTFIFTAYTGSAASLFGGATISKAAFLNQHKQLSFDDKNE
jgi:hypothetical protein